MGSVHEGNKPFKCKIALKLQGGEAKFAGS